MSGLLWMAARNEGLCEAHRLVRKAFSEQLEWWVFLPFIGIPRLIRRDKLIRIGQYLIAQMEENIADYTARKNQ